MQTDLLTCTPDVQIESVKFPVQVPVMPQMWQDSHVGTDIPHATVHFDKAVVSSDLCAFLSSRGMYTWHQPLRVHVGLA